MRVFGSGRTWTPTTSAPQVTSPDNRLRTPRATVLTEKGCCFVGEVTNPDMVNIRWAIISQHPVRLVNCGIGGSQPADDLAPLEFHLRFGFWVSGSGFRVSGFGFRVSVSGFGFGFRFRVSGFGLRVSGFGFRVSGFWFRVSGFGFRVSGFGSRVYDVSLNGSGFWLGVFRFWVLSFGCTCRCLITAAETYKSLGFRISSFGFPLLLD